MNPGTGGGASQEVVISLRLAADARNGAVSQQLAQQVHAATDTATKAFQSNGHNQVQASQESCSRIGRVYADLAQTIARFNGDFTGKSQVAQMSLNKQIERMTQDTETRVARIKEDSAIKKARVAESAQRQHERQEQARQRLLPRQDVSQEGVVHHFVGGYARMAEGARHMAGAEKEIQKFEQIITRRQGVSDLVGGSIRLSLQVGDQLHAMNRLTAAVAREQQLLNNARRAGTALSIGRGMTPGAADAAARQAARGAEGTIGDCLEAGAAQGSDLSGIEARYSAKHGLFTEAVTKHFLERTTDEERADLRSGVEGRVQVAQKALVQMKAKGDKTQKAVNDSDRAEKELRNQYYDTRSKIADVKKATLPPSMQPRTELSGIEPAVIDEDFEVDHAGHRVRRAKGSRVRVEHLKEPHGPKEHSAPRAGHRDLSLEFEKIFDEALQKQLVPAIQDSIRRAAARINNASSIG